MKEQRIIEEMARLDPYIEAQEFRYYEFGKCRVRNRRFRTFQSVPDYLNSHDACQRVIDKMDAINLEDYWSYLGMITVIGQVRNGSEFCHFWKLKATPRQKCEAILKAYGKWEKN